VDPRGDADPIEVEWQFDAIDLRPVERWLAALRDGTVSVPGTARLTLVDRPVQRLVDRYVDTDDWRLGRSGYVLRARRKGNALQATLKDNAPATDGLRRRLEVSEPLPAEGLDALDGQGPVGRRVRALAGGRELVQLIEVRTRRRPFELQLDGIPVAEVALDESQIDVAPGQEPVRLRRVEVEVDPSRADELVPLVEQLRRECGLRSATLSKFEAGLLAAGLQIPAKADFGPVTFGAEPTLGEVVFASLRRAFVSMVDHEPGTRIGEDPEELHDMRVATRRMRAAMAQFADALPVRTQQLRAELGWLAAVLGATRDLDVQIEQLTEWTANAPEADREALANLAGVLRAHSSAARRELLVALDGSRYGRLVSGLETLLRSGPSSRIAPARALATDVLPDSIGQLHAAARKAGRRAARTGEAADFHRLRIRCKRLRYALEFVAELYPDETVRFRRQMVGLQDLLGKFQDAQVASARLRELAVATGDEALPAATIFLMGGLAERYEQDAARILAALPGRVSLVAGTEWRSLVQVMEARRAPLPPPPFALGPVGQLTPVPPGPL
jgi:triphosphatase